MTTPVDQSGADADRPRHVVADHQPHHDRGADAAGEAGGQVDLAEQQHEDQAHRQQHGAGALGQHVAEVVEAPERRLDAPRTGSPATIRPATAGSEPISPPRTRCP